MEFHPFAHYLFGTYNWFSLRFIVYIGQLILRYFGYANVFHKFSLLCRLSFFSLYYCIVIIFQKPYILLHRCTLLLFVFTPPSAVYATLVVNAALVTAATLLCCFVNITIILNFCMILCSLDTDIGNVIQDYSARFEDTFSTPSVE